MSYHQDGAGGSIIHLPASTHTAYSQVHRQQQGNMTSTTTARIMNYGTTTMNTMNTMHAATSLNIAATTATNITSPMASIMPTGSSPNINSGNLSMDSHPSLMEAGELLLTAPVVPTNHNISSGNINSGNINSNSSHRRGKPDVAIIMSFLSFIVWLRLLQTMFYQSTLGQLGGFVKELLCVFLVWIPSVTLTCFYFRSDDYQHPHQRRYFRSWGR